MLLDTLNGVESSFDLWLEAGGRDILVGLGLIAEGSPRPDPSIFERLRRLRPDVQVALDATLPFATWRNVLIVHAALPSGGPRSLGDEETLLDGRTFLHGRGPRGGTFASLRGVVVGHVPHSVPTFYHDGQTLAIDTNAPHGGSVTVVQLPPTGPLSGARFFARAA